MKIPLLTALLLLTACARQAHSEDPQATALREKLKAIPMSEKVNFTNEEWKKILTPEQYHVLRQAGTEKPYANEYCDTYEKGTYVCAACGYPLFDSSTKFACGTGWPAFFQPSLKDHIRTSTDTSFGMVREAVTCARCGSHLGHVFDDGPEPTHLRYCMNSAALKLVKAEKK